MFTYCGCLHCDGWVLWRDRETSEVWGRETSSEPWCWRVGDYYLTGLETLEPGLDSGTDGAEGGNTERAIRRFKRGRNMPNADDPTINEALLAALD